MNTLPTTAGQLVNFIKAHNFKVWRVSDTYYYGQTNDDDFGHNDFLEISLSALFTPSITVTKRFRDGDKFGIISTKQQYITRHGMSSLRAALPLINP